MRMNDIGRAVSLTTQAEITYAAIARTQPVIDNSNPKWSITRLREGKLYLANKQAQLAAQRNHSWKPYADIVNDLFQLAR